MKRLNNQSKEFIKFFNSIGAKFIDSETGEEIKVEDENEAEG